MTVYVVIASMGDYATSIQFVTCDYERAQKAREDNEHWGFEEYDLEDVAAGIAALEEKAKERRW